uniref:Capsid protein n=1 Tax=Parvoviridae sp. TaxID=1940570 RepID=A0A7D3QJV1_9VIRU|nr:MAG: capsid protein [Parvoviridae sp.]
MTETYTVSNIYCAYIENKEYVYPSVNQDWINEQDSNRRTISTGWQVIPNILWSHYMSPKQWAEFMINYEAYHVRAAHHTIFNPIPITMNLAIQRTNMFAAFNNCVYCLGYTDDIHETNYFDWYEAGFEQKLNLAYKEGMIYASDGTHRRRYVLPEYQWMVPNMRTTEAMTWGQGVSGEGVFVAPSNNQIPYPAGIFWDPMNRPDHLMELRAGKNAMTYKWECHETDADRWYNMDQLALWAPYTPTGPYCGGKRPSTWKFVKEVDPDPASTRGQAERHMPPNPGTSMQPWQDYTIPDLSQMPIVPMAWWWKEIQNNIVDPTWFGYSKIDKYYAGTEWEQYKYPPFQHFIKGIPIWDAQDNMIETTTQVAIKTTLILDVKKRRSAYYAPTWGPFSAAQLYHHTRHKMIYQPNMIRYKTAGARRGWQNIGNTNDSGQLLTNNAFQREDPYIMPREYWNAPGQHPTRDSETAGETDENIGKGPITVTFNKDSERIVFTAQPKARERKRPTEKQKSPDKYADVAMMEHLTPL